MKIRNVMDSDLESIVNIYNHYIENTTVLLEEERVTIDMMSILVQETKEMGFPWLVLDIDGVVQGFCYATEWRTKSHYKETVQPFIYLANDQTKRGFGVVMYNHLLYALRLKGYKNAIGVITLPNKPSIKLHEQLGFKKVGEFSDFGVKFNHPLSVGYWQLNLSV